MLIAAVDPGLTTGLALYDTTDPTGVWTGDALSVPAVRDFLSHLPEESVVVVEDYVGGGYRTTEAIFTLKLLGFIEHFGRYLGHEVVVQTPQKRLHRRKDAETLLGTGVSPHRIAALSHALAYAGQRDKPNIL